MPLPKKQRREQNNEEESDTDDEAERGELTSPSCTVATNATGAATNSTKLKCLKCFRAARKDCTGNLCIRCCTDDNCVVHQEQRARARWKEAVIEGTTEIQLKAKRKRSRAIPKGRFREQAFRYMNDTVVLWDLKTVLEPSLLQQQQTSSVDLSPTKGGGTPATAAVVTTTNLAQSISVSSKAMAQYQNDLKLRDEILRRSRKNNLSSSDVKTKFRRNYRATRKQFRSVMENLYQKSLE